MTTRQFSRRDALKSGAALAGAGALGNLSLFANAWANANAWKPEKGAKLQILRWKRFVQSEEDAYMALVAAFTQATGVEVKVLNESLDDVQPKAEDLAQHITPAVVPALDMLAAKLKDVEWTAAAISAAFKQVLADAGLKMPQLAMPVRVLVMGTPQTPSVDQVLFLCGREKVLARLAKR